MYLKDSRIKPMWTGPVATVEGTTEVGKSTDIQHKYAMVAKMVEERWVEMELEYEGAAAPMGESIDRRTSRTRTCGGR